MSSAEDHGMDKVMDEINAFLAESVFAVAGASTNRDKYGNKVVRAYQQAGLTVHPMNHKEPEVEGLKAFPDVPSLPDDVTALSVVTPPPITKMVLQAAVKKGIREIWIQPGAEHQEAIAEARAAGANVIADGPCLLIALHYTE